VEEAAERLERPGQALTLTHGDPGPDNALITPRGVVLVDFEKAGRRHALTDVAQWHVGPPLPEAVVHRMDARYREAVGSALGPLDDAGWAHALRPLVVHRVVLTLAGMLHTLCARDVPLQSGFGGRAVLLSVLARQRWRTDGLGELAQAVLDAVDVDWSVVPPRYPCFEESP
jgi:Ser/Thr protein kinase RdoA (MazF antagonist)